MNPGYVYFLHAEGTDRYKIGLTKDIDRRLKELNGEQAMFPVRCLWYISVADMRSAEKWLHDACSDRRVHGEWFVFNQAELDSVGNLYDEAQSKFSLSYQPQTVYQTQSSPSVNEPRYEYDRSIFDIPPELIFAGVVAAIGFVAWLFSFGQQRSAIVDGLTNVRKTPNGEILCTVSHGTRIKILDSANPQWLNTPDACPQGAGMIFKARVREIQP